MSPEPELYYFYRPTGPRTPARAVEFLSVQAFLADEPVCKTLW
jgi:hypothetical protein